MVDSTVTRSPVSASSARADIEAALKRQPWFQASDEAVQGQLLSLPGDLTPAEKESKRPDQNCNGFLADLANRPAEGGGVRVLRVLEVLVPQRRPIYGIFAQFEVQKIAEPGKIFAYEYFGWRQGPGSGAKGLVLIEDGTGNVTHVVILMGYSFAAAKITEDLTGGFAEAGETSVSKLPERFMTEIREELGVPNLQVKRMISLGAYYPDRGMTNNCPSLFAAVIDGSNAARIPVGECKNPDPHEMVAVPNIVPVERLWGEQGLIANSKDGYFQACVSRLLEKGVLRQPLSLALGASASTAVRELRGSQTTLNVAMTADRKKGWSTKLQLAGGGLIDVTSMIEGLVLDHPSFGTLSYGLTPGGYDGWSFHEVKGGGAVILPYALVGNRLYVGVVEEMRHNQGGKVLNVPRGFADLKDKDKAETAQRELLEEMGYAAGSGSMISLGSNFNPNSTFFETRQEGEGVAVFGVMVSAEHLEPCVGGYVFKSGVLNTSGKHARLVERIGKARFIHWREAIDLSDGFTVAAVGRLRAYFARQEI